MVSSLGCAGLIGDVMLCMCAGRGELTGNSDKILGARRSRSSADFSRNPTAMGNVGRSRPGMFSLVVVVIRSWPFGLMVASRSWRRGIPALTFLCAAFRLRHHFRRRLTRGEDRFGSGTGSKWACGASVRYEGNRYAHSDDSPSALIIFGRSASSVTYSPGKITKGSNPAARSAPTAWPTGRPPDPPNPDRRSPTSPSSPNQPKDHNGFDTRLKKT